MSSRFLPAVLAAGFLLAPAAAQAAITETGSAPVVVTTDNDTFTAFDELANGWFVPAFTGGLFDSLLLSGSSPANLSSACSCSFGSSVFGYQFDFTGTTGSAIQVLFGSATGWTGGIGYSLLSIVGDQYTWALNEISLENGPYRLGLNFGAEPPTTNVTVPGPIAGAGLPLMLGFAGYAAWRRRQGAKAAA